MAGVGALVSSLLSLASNLLPKIRNSFFTPSSSSSAQSPNASDVEDDLNALMRMLESIKKALCVVEEREFRDRSVKLWLKRLKEVGYAAEYVIDEYMYEVYRAQVEARNAFKLNPHKRKQEGRSVAASCVNSIRVPDGIADHIREIRNNFDEIEKHREALHLPEYDGPRRDGGVQFRAPTSHLFKQSSVFGREKDKEKVIDLLLSDVNKGIITVVPIIGKGGIGKTTLAQIVFDDARVKHNFNLFGWTHVSEDFVVERLLQNLIESFTPDGCPLNDACALNEKIKNIVDGKRVLIVLDDVWNENEMLWESFHVPFMSALSATFLVTTRSDAVAKTMQATSLFRLGYLSEEDSWSLFRHYAFRGTDSNVNPKMLYIGRQITEKCGGLPLAVKSISNLLRIEGEKKWINILQNDMWDDSDDDKKVIKVLQISYTHMPVYLRPCFLYCSLFPKNYEYHVNEVIELWIAQGYIEFKEGRSLEDIAIAYARELSERSFFDIYIGKEHKILWSSFQIHDIVHDLARLNSEREFYYVERGKAPNPYVGVLHFYMDGSEAIFNHLTPDTIAKLRTIVIRSPSKYINISDAKCLRTLKLYKRGYWYEKTMLNFVFPKHLRFLEINCNFEGRLSDSVFSLYHLERLTLNLLRDQMELEAIRNLINLQYLSLSQCNVVKLLESLSLLRNLRMLRLIGCLPLGGLPIVLPENIGDLAQLEELLIHNCSLEILPESFCSLQNLITLRLTKCRGIRELPKDLGNLTNLQSLIINDLGISYLPDNIDKLITCPEFDVGICPIRLNDTVAWLNGLNNLKGTLVILQLGGLPKVENARNFNLISKPNIEKLLLSWAEVFPCNEENKLEININRYSTRTIKDKDLHILESLQPHPNLKHFGISYYENSVFPRWMVDPLYCPSLKTLHIDQCHNITYLPFGNLNSLSHLKIVGCSNLETISRESLPSRLRSLIIYNCFLLLSITGLHDLEALVELKIQHCKLLGSFSFEFISEERGCKPPLSGLQNLFPPKIVKIGFCPKLQLTTNEVVPSANWKIEIYNC